MLKDAEKRNGPSSSLRLRQMVSKSVFEHRSEFEFNIGCIYWMTRIWSSSTQGQNQSSILPGSPSAAVYSPLLGTDDPPPVPIMNKVSIRVCQAMCTALQVLKQQFNL